MIQDTAECRNIQMELLIQQRLPRCLFTCLVTRAVHIEVSPSLEGDDFINVLNGFIIRRGNPELIRSDCGTNFVGATNELKKEIEQMNHLKISKSISRKEIKWKINPPDAPDHMGGIWERLIRIIKTTLSVILCESATLNDFTLQTGHEERVCVLPGHEERICVLPGQEEGTCVLPGHKENALCASWARRKNLCASWARRK